MTREEWNKLTPDEQWRKFAAIQPSISVFPKLLSGGEYDLWHDIPPWVSPVDDKGNPPPPGLCGDMFPLWYDGQWWVCHNDYMRRRRANGEQS